MAENLRQLLIQRAARLQERPAFTSGEWGTLSYGQFRNRVEGIALGLMADDLAPGRAIFCPKGGSWAWAAEVAAACCGLRWDEAGQSIPEDILGGLRFNDEQGRGPYHEGEHHVEGRTQFSQGLDHGAMLLRLGRMNRVLDWDHDTVVPVPVAEMGSKAGRAALWCSLYGGSHAILEDRTAPKKGFLRRRPPTPAAWSPEPFQHFWDPTG